MKDTQESAQEKLNLQVLIPNSTHSIYRDLMKLDTSQSIEIRDFRIQPATFYSNWLFVYGYV